MTEIKDEVKTETIDETRGKSSGCNIFLERDYKHYEKYEYVYILVDNNDSPRTSPMVWLNLDIKEVMGVVLEFEITVIVGDNSYVYKETDVNYDDRQVIIDKVQEVEKLEVINRDSLAKLGFLFIGSTIFN